MYRILLIEDDFEIRSNAKEYFSSKGDGLFALDIAYDASDGLEKVRSQEYGLVMADIRQRGEIAFDQCRRLRENCKCPIIFISAFEYIEEIDLAYAIGADDYILKPVETAELFYLALEYVSGRKKVIEKLECGGIRMHPATGLVTVDGRVIELNDRLTMILKVLLENQPETVNRDTILKEVWGNGYSGSDRVVDTHIKQLRSLLGRKGSLIQTVKGNGYRIKGLNDGTDKDTKTSF